MAVQRVLADAPDRVRTLVGISPVPASGVPFDDEGWGLFSAAADSVAYRRTIIDLSTGNRLTGVWLDQMANRSMAHSDRDAFADYLVAWARTDFHEQIEGNPVPVLVVVGEHDPVVTADVMEATWLRWYPN